MLQWVVVNSPEPFADASTRSLGLAIPASWRHRPELEALVDRAGLHCPNCKTRKYCCGAEETVVALVAKFSSSDCHAPVTRSAQR
jgi:hypothetical protein